MPSGYNGTSGTATGGLSVGYAGPTGVTAMPSQMGGFAGAGPKVGVAQWVGCLVGAVVVVVW